MRSIRVITLPSRDAARAISFRYRSWRTVDGRNVSFSSVRICHSIDWQNILWSFSALSGQPVKLGIARKSVPVVTANETRHAREYRNESNVDIRWRFRGYYLRLSMMGTCSSCLRMMIRGLQLGRPEKQSDILWLLDTISVVLCRLIVCFCYFSM